MAKPRKRTRTTSVEADSLRAEGTHPRETPKEEQLREVGAGERAASQATRAEAPADATPTAADEASEAPEPSPKSAAAPALLEPTPSPVAPAPSEPARPRRARRTEAAEEPAPAPASPPAEAKPTRRTFLATMGGLGAIWGVGSLYPVYKFLAPKPAAAIFDDEGKAAVEKVSPGDVAAPNTGKNGGYGNRGLVIYRNAEGKLRAFDSKCTHAGCTVAYKGDTFYCACHGGTYDLDGKNIAGPPPKPLEELGVFERDGVLYVTKTLDAAKGA